MKNREEIWWDIGLGGGGDWWKVLGFGTMVVMEPDMQHRMPWYDRYEASSGNFVNNAVQF